MDDHHTSNPCLIRSVYILLMTSQSIAYNVIIVTHARKIRSNSLDIDFYLFIRDRIHSRSCKNSAYFSSQPPIAKRVFLFSRRMVPKMGII